MGGQPNTRGILAALIAAHLCIDLTQGAVPALGSYMENFHNWSYTQVGSLALITSVTSVALQPLAGAYGDRARNGIMIPLGLLLTGSGLLLAALSSPASTLAITLGVALTGAGVAVFHPDGMRAAHFTTGDRRATGMSLFLVGGNLGIALGPVTAALGMSAFGLPGLLLAAVPSFAAFVLLARLLPALRSLWSRPRERPEEAKTEAGPVPVNWSGQIRVLAVVTLRAMFQMTVITYLPLYVTGVLGGSLTGGNFLTSLYLLGGAVGTLIGGPLADRIGLRRYLTGSLALIGPTHFLTLAAPAALKPFLLMVQGGMLVSTMAISIVLSQEYAPSNLALVSGLNAGANIGLGGLGAALAGMAADTWGLLPVLTVAAALPILAALVSRTLPPTEPAAPAGAGSPAGGAGMVQYEEPDGGR
ncbi:MAG TPA: MFS transporter [Sphingobacteriaceae bacterium]|nr:MFS transporter [Sphingobacteriaceae bacterium]